MPEPRHDPRPALVDLIGLSIRELAALDDDLVMKTLDSLLPECGTLGGRLWQNNNPGTLSDRSL